MKAILKFKLSLLLSTSIVTAELLTAFPSLCYAASITSPKLTLQQKLKTAKTAIQVSLSRKEPLTILKNYKKGIVLQQNSMLGKQNTTGDLLTPSRNQPPIPGTRPASPNSQSNDPDFW